MKPLAFPLPALICLEPGPEEPEPPLFRRPQTLLYALPQREDDSVSRWIEEFSIKIPEGESGLVMADCGMPVPQQRAALLACARRPESPPFISCLALDEEGLTLDGWDGEAALILLQSMGCAAVIFVPADEEALKELPRLFSRLWQDARIPVGVAPSFGGGAQIAASFPRASLLMGADAAACQDLAQRIAQAKLWTVPPSIAPPPEDDWFIAVSNRQDHLLDPAFDIDGQLECQPDFIEQLMELEIDGCDALRLILPDEDALDVFAAEQYMITMPLSLCAPDAALMERALEAFAGRAVYDGSWPLPQEDLDRFVERYGLIVL